MTVELILGDCLEVMNTCEYRMTDSYGSTECCDEPAVAIEKFNDADEIRLCLEHLQLSRGYEYDC